MLRTRVIPILLLKGRGLVKTVKFANPKYVGDPLNAVRIFNEKEVDELAFLDIEASQGNRGPNFDFLKEIASEAFMPFGYGGGISTVEHAKKLFQIGIEKVILNLAAIRNPKLITQIAEISGSQSVIVSIDARKNFWGNHKVWCLNGTEQTNHSPVELAKVAENLGAGEIIINSIDQDGTCAGYDLGLISSVASAVSIPVVASGGAGTLDHLAEGISAGASAVAAGSMFVFHGKHRAVLITYPDYMALQQKLEKQ